MLAVTQKEAQASDKVVEGVITITNTLARCLSDSSSTHSFVALHFVPKLGVAPTFMDVRLMVAKPVSVSLDTDVIYRGCIIGGEGRWLPANLVLLHVKDFDVFFGIDWLADYHAMVDYYHKMISLAPV